MGRSRCSGLLSDLFCPPLNRPGCPTGLVLPLKAWAESITHATRLRQRRSLPEILCEFQGVEVDFSSFAWRSNGAPSIKKIARSPEKIRNPAREQAIANDSFGVSKPTAPQKIARQ
jgi:hypothetical protein